MSIITILLRELLVGDRMDQDHAIKLVKLGYTAAKSGIDLDDLVELVNINF